MNVNSLRSAGDNVLELREDWGMFSRADNDGGLAATGLGRDDS